MGLRFRKSVKIAPGVKVNFNKKSVGVTFGKKGAHYTVNSTGKRTATVGIPGTGLSYSTSSGGGKSKKATHSNASPTDNFNIDQSTPEKNKGGCGGCLLSLLGVCLILALITYAWVPGIIAIIYFAKKTPDPKEKKKRVGIAAVVTLISFAVFLSSLGESKLTGLQADFSATEYDIHETPEVELTLIPSDASIDTLTICENNIAELEYVDGVATIIFKEEGTETLFFTANDSVASNSTTITVIDKQAEAERKAAEEEAQRLAEEEAQRKAEEEAAALAAQQAQEPQEEMVWIPSSGSKYHSRSGCSGMENPTEVTLSDAKARGYAACQRCH